MREEILLNPEVYLKELNRRLQILYRDVLPYGNREIEMNIKNLLKKTIVSEILSEKYTIAISGLQGVGKTTLLKYFYDIPEDIIPETRGIGEKIPVMITEWNSDDYGYSAKIVEQIKDEKTGRFLLELQEVQIGSNEEFKRIAMEPSSEYIYLELKVPYKYFKTDEKSFVLLPGVDQSNDGWNELTRHVLYNSANCILVFNEQRLNDNNNTILVNNIKQEFNDSKPIIALTFGDQSNDCNMSLKNEVIERFNITEEETDRVIRTSVDKAELDRWREELIKALGKYSNLQKKSRLKQLEVLNKILGEDLEGILLDLSVIDFEDTNMRNSGAKESLQKIMKSMTKQKNEIKKIYRKKLGEELAKIAQKASTKFRDSIIDKNIFGKFVGSITGESLKKRKDFEERIIEAWKCGEGINITPLSEKLVIDTMNEEYSGVFVLEEYKQLLLSEGEREIAATSIIEIKPSREEIKERKKLNRACKDIVTLFSNDGKESLTDKVTDSIEYLPLLALNMMLLREGGEEYSEGFGADISGMHSTDNMDMAEDLTGNVINIKQGVLKGIVAVLGIDSIDGTGDIIKAIAASIGVTLSAGATVAISAGIGLGIVGINFISKINKMDMQSDNQGKMLIHIIKEENFTKMDGEFSELIDKIFDKIEKQLRKGYGLEEAEARSIRCNKNIMDLHAFKNEIRENIYGHICYLG
ncbi:MAG: hypothetical protein ACRC28_05030 [Clostridium sp.]|uniref:hypothetical protein n=1 Tax=Clostridium sp. TaxID=1506 RepID=UPI003F2F1C0B